MCEISYVQQFFYLRKSGFIQKIDQLSGRLGKEKKLF